MSVLYQIRIVSAKKEKSSSFSTTVIWRLKTSAKLYLHCFQNAPSHEAYTHTNKQTVKHSYILTHICSPRCCLLLKFFFLFSRSIGHFVPVPSRLNHSRLVDWDRLSPHRHSKKHQSKSKKMRLLHCRQTDANVSVDGTGLCKIEKKSMKTKSACEIVFVWKKWFAETYFAVAADAYFADVWPCQCLQAANRPAHTHWRRKHCVFASGATTTK